MSPRFYTVEEEGPKEGTDLIRVLEPADRILVSVTAPLSGGMT